jgi:two-component system, NarL family, nitrate/nitrite response regulator NarL
MSETVVIVDDHGGFRACARQLLEAEGFEVIGEAADAASGVAVVGDLHPDIVLLDVQLPDTDGVQAARSIAALKGSSAIVLISSRDVSDLLGADVETPARGFIPKWELSGPSIRELLV